MSTRHRWLCRGAVALLAAASILALLSSARAGGDDFGTSPKLAADKLEQEVKGAIAEAQLLKAKEPDKALFLLNACKQKLTQDTNLTKARRTELLALVAQHIQAVAASANGPAKKKKDDDLYDQYEKAKQGKPGSGGTGGTGAAGTAGSIIGGLKGKYDDQQKAKADADKGHLSLLKPPGLGDIPPGDSVVKYSKDWAKILDLRKKLTNLTKEEAAVLKAMNTTLEKLDYVKQPFQDVLTLLGKKTGLTIIIDPNAMKALELEYNTPVTLQADKISARAALKRVLGEVGLAYILKGDVVQVVTPQVAQNTMTLRSYYVGDLMPPPMPGAGPFFNQAREQWHADQIMAMIVTTVEPQSWAPNGPGTISYNPVSKAIVVRNSAEMHLSLKSSLSSGP